MQTFKDPSQFAVIKWGKKSHEFKIPTTHEEIEDHFRVDVISFKKQSLDGDLVITDGSKLTPGFWEMDAEGFEKFLMLFLILFYFYFFFIIFDF